MLSLHINPAERIAEITPLRVKFTSEDHQEQLTVIQRNASEIKQSIFQVGHGSRSRSNAYNCNSALRLLWQFRCGNATCHFVKSVPMRWTQITDVSQLGDLSAVAALLLPREVTVEAQGSAIIEQPVPLSCSHRLMENQALH